MKRTNKRSPTAATPGAAIEGDIKVGRGRPPLHTRFKKGESGNKKGRPKGSRNLSTVIMEASRAPINVTIGGKSRRISKLQATAMQLATRAADGNPNAMSKFLDWIDEIEHRAAAEKPVDYPFNAGDLEVLHAIRKRMRDCMPPEGEI
jgi:hypothetical protein